MKKLTLIAIFLLFVFLVLPHQIIAAQEATDQFDLKVVNIETEPDAIRVGEETKFIISYANNGSMPMPPNTAAVFLAVVDLNTNTDKVLEICMPESFTESGIPVAENNADPERFIFPECTFTPTEVGALSIQAGFVPPGTDTDDISDALISDEAFDILIEGNAAQNLPESLAVNVQPYESNLPDDLARVFAGLGIFFAIMAIVAVGTEVVIDTCKVALGFKSKVTATKALEKMEKYMPGQLASLGVSQERIGQFKQTTADMRLTLRTYLDPVDNLIAARNFILAGEFAEAYADILTAYPVIDTAVKNGTAKTDAEIKKLVDKTRPKMKALVVQVCARLTQVFNIEAAKFDPLKAALNNQIDVWAEDLDSVEDLKSFLDSLFESIREFEAKDWAAELAKQQGWLENQTETFKRGSEQVVNLFKAQVAPLLVGIGFGEEVVSGLQQQIADNLDAVEANINEASDLYLDSLRNVLNAVEQRRFQTQSPARKLWRALRSWSWGVFWPHTRNEKIITFLLLILAIPAMLTAAIWIIPGVGNAGNKILFIGSFIAIVIVGIFIFRRWNRENIKLSIHGLYGVFVLSLLLALFGWLLIWILQPTDANVRLFGNLMLGSVTLPSGAWIVFGFLTFFILVIILGEIVGRYAYTRLIRQKPPGETESGTERAERIARETAEKEKWDAYTTLIKVETLWNLLREGFDINNVEPEQFDQPDSVAHYEAQAGLIVTEGEKNSFKFDQETAAQFILMRSDQQRDEESSRLRWLRVLSFFIGVAIAYLLNIDAVALLGEAFPAVSDFNYIIVSGEALHSWKAFLQPDRALTAGIILTGFAAAAGSAFWHDRLGQLQATKKGAETAVDLLKQAQGDTK